MIEFFEIPHDEIIPVWEEAKGKRYVESYTRMAQVQDENRVDCKQIAKRVKELRRARGLTQTQLATAANLSKNHVSRIENALTPTVNKRTIDKLAVGLECSYDDLTQRATLDQMESRLQEIEDAVNNPHSCHTACPLPRPTPKNRPAQNGNQSDGERRVKMRRDELAVRTVTKLFIAAYIEGDFDNDQAKLQKAEVVIEKINKGEPGSIGIEDLITMAECLDIPSSELFHKESE